MLMGQPGTAQTFCNKEIKELFSSQRFDETTTNIYSVNLEKVLHAFYQSLSSTFGPGHALSKATNISPFLQHWDTNRLKLKLVKVMSQLCALCQ